MKPQVQDDKPVFSEILWALPQNVNKYNRGSVLMVAGSTGMAGAGVLAADAAIRAGVGLVTLAHPDSLIEVYGKMLPETMTMPLPSTPAGTLAQSAAEAVLTKADSFNVLAIGPGLSKNSETQAAVVEILMNWKKPKVVDASALTAYVARPELYDEFTIITPHASEMRELFTSDRFKKGSQIEADKLAAAEEFAALHPKPILVLKGHGTVIVNGSSGRIVISKTGSPGLAKAGTGDVLTGIMAGLVAQNQDKLFESAATAVYLHGLAGDLAENSIGERSITASDVIKFLPKAVKEAEK